MGLPSKEALWNWASNYDKLWNAGDKQAWIDNYRTVVQGDAVRMFDPVSTPEKFGFKHCCEDSWDLFQPRVRFRIQPGTLFGVLHLLFNTICMSHGIVCAHTVTVQPGGRDRRAPWH